MFHTALLPLSCFLSFSLTRISSPGCVWVFWNSDDNSIQIGEWMKADRWRDTNRKPCWCPVCQSPLIHVQTLDGSETKKKARPNLFHSVASLSFFVTGASVLINGRTISRIKSMCSLLSLASTALLFFPLSPPLSLFLPDRSDIRNLYYQVFPGCWWKSWFATPDWIYLSFIPFQPPASCPSRQEPNGLSTRRCQGIKISIYRKKRGEGGRGETEGGKGREGTECRPTCHSFGQLGEERGGQCTPCRAPWNLFFFQIRFYFFRNSVFSIWIFLNFVFTI